VRAWARVCWASAGLTLEGGLGGAQQVVCLGLEARELGGGVGDHLQHPHQMLVRLLEAVEADGHPQHALPLPLGAGRDHHVCGEREGHTQIHTLLHTYLNTS
jgi:hypothetical protein